MPIPPMILLLLTIWLIALIVGGTKKIKIPLHLWIEFLVGMVIVVIYSYISIPPILALILIIWVIVLIVRIVKKLIAPSHLWVNVLVGVILAIYIFMNFLFSLNEITHHEESKKVPLVVGKSYEEAKEILDKAGFDIEIQDSIYVDTVKPMKVLKQVPESEEVVKVNRKVYLTINRAVPPMVDMPNLVGYSFRNAEMTLKNNNLRLGDTTFKPDFARNAVLEQWYKGATITTGTKIRMGSTISLVLGDGVGNREFSVPVITGMTFCDAKEILEANGIVIGSIVGNSDIKDTCSAWIYKQNPERFDEEKRILRIRSGQTMDVWLQLEKPVTDTTIKIDLPL
jgi:beta-lactam-binding protein with PASTA domain